jgi:RNA polymerase sigma factor (TIGR02999 family)
MTTPSPLEVTQLLLAWSNGDQAALDKLAPIVYAELRRRAHRYMGRERSDHSLQTTALVHEAYLRLVDYKKVRWQNRAHFFAVSARMMRRILVDYARARGYQKRGGQTQRLSLDEALIVSRERSADLVALDDALAILSGIDPRMSQVVELRFFGGLSVEETAEVLRISTDTVTEDWKLAKSWLFRRLNSKKRQ